MAEDGGISDEFDPTLVDKRLVTDAAILGQSTAFPACDELNEWFREVGHGAMNNGLEFVSWKTPSGSLIRQEYREPTTKKVKTHAMGGAMYRTLSESTDSKGRIRLSVQTGWGKVKENKASTALGANFTHSLDADIIHGLVNNFDKPVMLIHDCAFALATDVDECMDAVRASFHRTLSEDNLQSLLDTNGLQDQLSVPAKGDGDLDLCLESQHIFS